MSADASDFDDRTIGASWAEENDVSEIVGFDIVINDTTVDITSPTVSTYALYGLPSNTTYRFYINAVLDTSSNATELVSNTVTASTTVLSRPSTMPQPVLVDVGGGFLRVRVDPPKDTGGLNVTSINVAVQATFDSKSFLISKNSSATDFNVYGLSARTQYLVYAYATNGGTLSSIPSEFLSVTTLGPQLAGPCPAPTLLNVTGTSRIYRTTAFAILTTRFYDIIAGGSVALQLNPPLDNGTSHICYATLLFTTI